VNWSTAIGFSLVLVPLVLGYIILGRAAFSYGEKATAAMRAQAEAEINLDKIAADRDLWATKAAQYAGERTLALVGLEDTKRSLKLVQNELAARRIADVDGASDEDLVAASHGVFGSMLPNVPNVPTSGEADSTTPGSGPTTAPSVPVPKPT